MGVQKMLQSDFEQTKNIFNICFRILNPVSESTCLFKLNVKNRFVNKLVIVPLFKFILKSSANKIFASIRR